MKLKILASFSFVSGILPEKLFYDTFLKIALASVTKLLYGTEAKKTVSLVKACVYRDVSRTGIWRVVTSKYTSKCEK